MFFINHIELTYFIVTTITMFLLITPTRILQLLPVGIFASCILFATEEYFISLGQYKFNDSLLFIADVPLFHLLAAISFGIIVMHFMKKDFAKKMLMILLYSLIVWLMGYIAQVTGSHTHFGRFTQLHNFIQDVVMITFFVLISEHIFNKQITMSQN